jgi:alpha-glucosidase
LDYVPNHSSDQHEWFIKSEARDPEYENYYIWSDGKPNPEGGRNLPPNNWISVFRGPAWTWSDKRQQYYFHQFTKQQPDLNYRHQPVINKMKNVMWFWLAKGVYGFRCDAVNTKNYYLISYVCMSMIFDLSGEPHVRVRRPSG